MPCENPNPTEFEVLQTIMEAGGVYCRFSYKPLAECYRKMTPSRWAARADTRITRGGDSFTGWLYPDGIGTDTEDDSKPQGNIKMTKDSNFILCMRTMTRQKALPTGTGYFADKSNLQPDGTHKDGFEKNEFFYRSVRLDRHPFEGIDLTTFEVLSGGRFIRLFPAMVCEPVLEMALG